MAEEGINGTVAGISNSIKKFESHLLKIGFHNYSPKYSYSKFMPFFRLKVRNKKEIVTLRTKTADPEKSYTAKLLNEGIDHILKKVSEEATETVIASKYGENAAIIHEIADLWFHTIILLKYHGLTTKDVLDELEKRLGISGIEEKTNRKK